ncbi:MAG TPA: carboxypeptidase-like regulatory domain-containing protein [Bryobacteraceae bacterium]|nr:carboxypeptidase-like regulatory domain-containing protein [Bryobacteraceae bacterium]
MAQQFSILNPCPTRWSDLTGEGRKRFCPHCQRDIHALDQYSTEEIETLRRESSGRLCGYLAGESLPPARSRRAVLVGALLTAISPLLAQSGRVRFRVSDQTGALVPDAEISLLDKENKVLLTQHADNAGTAVFTGLPMGVARFTVASPGFSTMPVAVTISSGKEVKVWANLMLSVIGESIEVPAPEPTGAAARKRKRKRWWVF